MLINMVTQRYVTTKNLLTGEDLQLFKKKILNLSMKLRLTTNYSYSPLRRKVLILDWVDSKEQDFLSSKISNLMGENNVIIFSYRS